MLIIGVHYLGFLQVKKWLDSESIGAIRTVSWRLHRPASGLDRSDKENWRTDAKIAPGGYFDDLASHGIDLLTYLLGDIEQVSGVSLNQQGLYSAKDAFAASWCHKNGITGTGSWNFGTASQMEQVEIFGSTGTIEFSIFDERPIVLNNKNGRQELVIEHPENVQLYHVGLMKEHLRGSSMHPSTGTTALHTSWVMDKILGNI